MLEVAYKDMSNGKVTKKNIVSFGNGAEVFKTMSTAKPTEYYNVTMEKGEKFWEWTKVVRGAAPTQSVVVGSDSMKTTSPGNARGFPTPEERARTQVYIVRQNSITNAVAILSVGAKTAPKTEDVIELAKRFEAFVFGSDTIETVAAKDVGGIEGLMEDPIPF